MRIGECVITPKGITCMQRSILNDYLFGYISIRFIEFLANDVICKLNNTDNLSYLLNQLDFS